MLIINCKRCFQCEINYEIQFVVCIRCEKNYAAKIQFIFKLLNEKKLF